MSTRHDEFLQHAVWERLAGVLGLLEASAGRLSDLAEDAIGFHTRIGSVIRYVRDTLERTDPDLVPFGRLDAVDQSIHSIAQQLVSFRDGGNIRNLTNASDECDNILIAVSGLPAVRYSEDVGNLRQDVADFRRSVSGYLRGIRLEAEGVRNNVYQAISELASLESAIELQDIRVTEASARLEDRTDTLTTEMLTQFSAAQERRTKEFDDLRGRLTEAAQTAVLTTDKRLDDHIVALEERVQEQWNLRTSEADELVTQLQEKLADAEKVVNAIGDTGTVGHYLTYASQQKREADIWRYITFVIYAAAAAVAGALFVWFPPDATAEDLARRAILTATVIGLAIFAGRQSAQHRQQERASRSLELQHAAMRPYLELLPEDMQNHVRIELASRYFVGMDASTPPLDPAAMAEKIRKGRIDLPVD